MQRVPQGRPADARTSSDAMSTFALGQLRVRRSGCGAMQLAGPFAFGEPPDRASAIGVLRAAVEAGVNHIDTAQYYGPDVVNDLIREALFPYPDGLAIVSKVAVRRDASGPHSRDRLGRPSAGEPGRRGPDPRRRGTGHIGRCALAPHR